MTFESNGITRGKLVATYIHYNRPAKNTRVDMEFAITEHYQRKLIKDGYLVILQKTWQMI